MWVGGCLCVIDIVKFFFVDTDYFDSWFINDKNLLEKKQIFRIVWFDHEWLFARHKSHNDLLISD